MKHLIHKHNGERVKIGDILGVQRGYTNEKEYIEVSRAPNALGWIGYGGDRPGVPYREVRYTEVAGVEWDKPHRVRLCDGDEVAYDGLHFTVKFPFDHDATEPWKSGDGYGIVSEWERRDKKPGEVVINSDRGRYRYYDWQASIAKAKRERWDAPPYGTGTKGERAARAVKADFEFLKAWCDNEWHFVGVEITCMDEDGNELGEDSCYGYETWKDYHEEAAWDMIEALAAQVKEQQAKGVAAAKALAQAQALERQELQAIANDAWAMIATHLQSVGPAFAFEKSDTEIKADFNRLCAKAGVQVA